MPDIRREEWNMDIGMREPFWVAIQLVLDKREHNRYETGRNKLIQSVGEKYTPETERKTHTLLNRPLKHSSLAFSSVNQIFSSTNLRSHFSSAVSYAETSPLRMAEIKGM